MMEHFKRVSDIRSGLNLKKGSIGDLIANFGIKIILKRRIFKKVSQPLKSLTSLVWGHELYFSGWKNTVSLEERCPRHDQLKSGECPENEMGCTEDVEVRTLDGLMDRLQNAKQCMPALFGKNSLSQYINGIILNVGDVEQNKHPLIDFMLIMLNLGQAIRNSDLFCQT